MTAIGAASRDGRGRTPSGCAQLDSASVVTGCGVELGVVIEHGGDVIAVPEAAVRVERPGETTPRRSMEASSRDVFERVATDVLPGLRDDRGR